MFQNGLKPREGESGSPSADKISLLDEILKAQILPSLTKSEKRKQNINTPARVRPKNSSAQKGRATETSFCLEQDSRESLPPSNLFAPYRWIQLYTQPQVSFHVRAGQRGVKWGYKKSFVNNNDLSAGFREK